MRSIFIKEINSFFSSIVGYVAVMVFLIACGLFLWVIPTSSILEYGYASLDRYFEMAPWLLMLLIPAITMRSFADEFRGGTIEWLSTKPLTDLDIIGGKYLASLALVVFAILPTLIYAYTVNNLALLENNIDIGSVIGSYIGLLFLAAGFTAIGIFCSSLTNNQIVGFLVALFACYILYFHYNSISRGFIDSRDVIYFLSVIVLFIALTRLSLNRRTWDTATQD
jgi:ABC-2 type transport system permease protein